MIDRLTAICLIASVCFAALLPIELRSHLAAPTVASPAIRKSNDRPPAPTSPPARKQLVATALARPLFSANRRPPENEQDAHQDTSLSDMRLTGILTMPDQHFAIFARSDGKPLVRSEGEMISDWRIDNISDQSVFLSGPNGTTTLEPKADPNLVHLEAAAQPAVPAANSPSPPPSNAPVRPAPVQRSQR